MVVLRELRKVRKCKTSIKRYAVFSCVAIAEKIASLYSGFLGFNYPFTAYWLRDAPPV